MYCIVRLSLHLCIPPRNCVAGKFFAREGDDRYELSYEVREGWTREWRDEMLELLDHLLCYSQQLFDKEHVSKQSSIMKDDSSFAARG